MTSYRQLLAVVLATTHCMTSFAQQQPPSAKVARPPAPVKKEQKPESPWTDWSDKNLVAGLLVLKDIRENLLEKNLYDPHVSYERFEAYGPLQNCDANAVRFRTADGTCNDAEHPYVGAAGVAFGRNIAPEFIDHNAAARLNTPNPKKVSEVFFTREEFKAVPFLNMLAASWIQFMNHDWLTHGKNMEENPHQVTNGDYSTTVDRTKVNPMDSKNYQSKFGKTTLNDVTHWWDASQIYGSNRERQEELRTMSLGTLRTAVVGGREMLPTRTDAFNPENNRQNQGYEDTGFNDNWWVGLSLLHTLFVKEHNAIAAEIYRNHVAPIPSNNTYRWTNGSEVLILTPAQLDEQIFQTARLVNSAILAKIHTVEWTPAILPNPTLKFAMKANWYGAINPNSWAPHEFINLVPNLNRTDWFHKELSYLIGGIVGQRTDNFGQPFSITEEFTSVYRLHSLLPENIVLRKVTAPNDLKAIPFAETRNEKTYGIMASNDLKDLYYSFGVQNPGQLVLNNFPKFMQNLEIPGRGIMDLGMVDIMRDRERGVPRYNQFRRGINLKPIKKYSDFFPGGVAKTDAQKAVLAKFEQVYGKDSMGRDNVEDIDLLVGTLSEEVRPKGFGFGETMFQIFILMASRRLMADRFFTVDYRPEIYTQTGLDWIDKKGTFAKVIVRHMPQLESKVKGLETAFNPWKK